MTVGEAIEAAFSPVLLPMGYVLAERSADGASFASPWANISARYVARDGELAVYVAPKDGGPSIQLLLYLRMLRSQAASILGAAVAESETDAKEQARAYAVGLREAMPLLRGDEGEVRRGRDLRWWTTDAAEGAT